MNGISEEYVKQYWADVEADWWDDGDDFDIHYLDKTYSGAPDECSKHYPEKLVGAQCDICLEEGFHA